MRGGHELVVIGLFAAVVATTAQAQSLYRCTKGGSIVYSETPCAPNAQRKQLDGQAPSEADADAARARAAAAAGDSKAIDRALESRLERVRQTAAAKPAEDIDAQAESCVSRYRPHLAYKSVRIESKRIETDGFGRTLYVQVRTITNPNTPVRFDPITISERFICRLNPQGGIDERYTEDYVTRHKNGQQL